MKQLQLKPKQVRTSALLPKKGFLVGMGSVFNMSGRYYSYNTSKTAEEADTRAIRNDWNMVGNEFRKAMKKLQNH